MVALAIHPTLRIGIDVERPRQQLIKVQHKYLNNNEMTILHNIEELLWAWTAKEAVYKAAGIPGLELASIALQLPVHGNASAEISDGHGALRKFALYSRFHNDIMTTIAIPR
jgi:phosphopantetheinyl transferase